MMTVLAAVVIGIVALAVIGTTTAFVTIGSIAISYSELIAICAVVYVIVKLFREKK